MMIDFVDLRRTFFKLIYGIVVAKQASKSSY